MTQKQAYIITAIAASAAIVATILLNIFNINLI